MSAARTGEVITFYSYKGGVGRSAAVANVATLLSQRGLRVLTIDFDVEAPGLHRYFATPQATQEEVGAERQGTIEFFMEVRAAFQRLVPSQARSEDLEFDEPCQIGLREAIAALLVEGRFLREVRLPDPNRPGESSSLQLMQAGRFDATYPDRVRAFPWQGFYEEFPCFPELLADELGKRFDYILIDSRTGTTDVGNLCTVLLPEKLVAVFTPNEQSLHGALQVSEQAVELRKQSVDVRPLPVFPLMSRVENAENELQRRWLTLAQTRFEQVFQRVYGVSKSLAEYFDFVQVPHRSFYAYGECIAATRERSSEVHSLAGAFRVFTNVLICNNAIQAQETIRGRLEAGSSSYVVPHSSAPPRARPAPSPASDASVLAFEAASRRPLARTRTALIAAVALSIGFVLLGLLFALPKGTMDIASAQSALAAGGGAAATPPSPAPPEPAAQVEASATATAPSSGAPVPFAPVSLGEVQPTAPTSVSNSRRPVATVIAVQPRPAAPGKPVSSDRVTVPRNDDPLAPVPSLPLSVDQALQSTLRLRGSATLRAGARTDSNKPVYDFSVWVDGPKAAVERIASVEYFFDHPTFVQKVLQSSRAPEFRQGYSGWGCITSVQVTIRWKSGALSNLPFDQCAAL